MVSYQTWKIISKKKSEVQNSKHQVLPSCFLSGGVSVDTAPVVKCTQGLRNNYLQIFKSHFCALACANTHPKRGRGLLIKDFHFVVVHGCTESFVSVADFGVMIVNSLAKTTVLYVDQCVSLFPQFSVFRHSQWCLSLPVIPDVKIGSSYVWGHCQLLYVWDIL